MMKDGRMEVETKGNKKHGINKTCVANFRLFSLYQAIQMIQQEIVVAKQQPEMRGGLNYIRKIYEKEKHYGER
jgi:hypothetical protein